MTIEDKAKIAFHQVLNSLTESSLLVIPGASLEALANLEKAIDIALPASLQQWLLFSNGSMLTQGGIYGADRTRDTLSIQYYQQMYPTWTINQWINIAGDGCGNSYVIDANPASSSFEYVFFIDCHQDDLALAYAVASNMWHFAFFALNQELSESRWPFDADYMVEEDPDLMQLEKNILPWR